LQILKLAHENGQERVEELRLDEQLKKLARYELVIIDDIGYVQHDRAEMEVLFNFFAERYERGFLMITSNLPFSKWEKSSMIP